MFLSAAFLCQLVECFDFWTKKCRKTFNVEFLSNHDVIIGVNRLRISVSEKEQPASS